MKRFRVTLLVVCCVLLWLGITDLTLTLNNPEPQPITAQQLLSDGPSQDWLTLEEGTLHLLDGVSTSGSLEIEALLVPVRLGEANGPVRLLLETRDAELIKHFSTYYILLETDEQKQAYLAKHRAIFFDQKARTGMITSGIVADSNRKKMLKLAQQIGLPVEEDVIFVSEGKTPPGWRGVFYLAAGLGGLIKLLFRWRSQGPKLAQDAA